MAQKLSSPIYDSSQGVSIYFPTQYVSYYTGFRDSYWIHENGKFHFEKVTLTLDENLMGIFDTHNYELFCDIPLGDRLVKVRLTSGEHITWHVNPMSS